MQCRQCNPWIPFHAFIASCRKVTRKTSKLRLKIIHVWYANKYFKWNATHIRHIREATKIKSFYHPSPSYFHPQLYKDCVHIVNESKVLNLVSSSFPVTIQRHRNPRTVIHHDWAADDRCWGGRAACCGCTPAPWPRCTSRSAAHPRWTSPRTLLFTITVPVPMSNSSLLSQTLSDAGCWMTQQCRCDALIQEQSNPRILQSSDFLQHITDQKK